MPSADDDVPCTPGYHVGEAIPIPDIDPEESFTHVCFGCGRLYDPASVEMWRELERGTGSGGAAATGS